MPTLQIAVLVFTTIARADDFDRLEGPILGELPTNGAATARKSLSIAELGSLTSPFREIRSAVLVVKTGEGNLARLLVSSALRKPQNGAGEPIPVVVLERFETFEMPGTNKRLARGRGILLFDGFRFDLDSGQVVPEGQGGDLQFTTKGGLVPEGSSALFSVEKSPLPKETGTGKPSPGRMVLATDFDGRYRVVANGQWSGTLDLKAGDQGVLTGRFRSDQTGASYKVTGFVPAEDPGLARFAVELPMARMEFDGRLWTVGKGAMAGSTTLLNRNFGFVALREGGKLSPDLEDAADWFAAAPEGSGRKEVILEENGKYRFEDRSMDLAALAELLAADKSAWVLLKVPASTPFSTVSASIRAIRAAGVAEVRLAPPEPAR